MLSRTVPDQDRLARQHHKSQVRHVGIRIVGQSNLDCPTLELPLRHDMLVRYPHSLQLPHHAGNMLGTSDGILIDHRKFFPQPPHHFGGVEVRRPVTGTEPVRHG